MKRFSTLIMTSAVAAVFMTPLAFAQQSDSTIREGDAAQTQPVNPSPSTGNNAMGQSGDSMSQSDTSTGSGQYGTETIREVQQALKDKGIETGPVDGIMGPKTKAAVEEFQQKEGLSGSGQLNHETLAALDVNVSGAMGSGSRPSSGSSSPSSPDHSGSGQSPSPESSSSPSPESSGSSSPTPGSTDSSSSGYGTTKRP
jgi:peptidoglycan hydrolase-like protein with peptidoglycan-binding domain